VKTNISVFILSKMFLFFWITSCLKKAAKKMPH